MPTMRSIRWVSCAVALPLAGCTPDPPPYAEVASVQEIMNAVLEPAADVYWDAVGWILDEQGVSAIAPSTPEEWEAVRNAAYVIAESGNLLMMEGRAKDRGPWMAMSRAMVEVGRQALLAAETEDEAAVFDAGAEVYYVCSACHVQYALETLNPSDTPSDSGGS